MKNKTLSLPSKIAIGVILFSCTMSIYLAYQYSFTPTGTSEFDAISVVAIGIISLLIIGLNSITILITIGLYKRKKWAWVTLLILMSLMFPILSIAALENQFENLFLRDIIFTIKISLPPLAIILLIMGRKDFRKSD